ncbi:hypothetical protein ABPG72_004267 [Tetrahymena utriculariae]
MQSTEEKKKTIKENFLNLLYNIFFDYNVVDMRDEMRKIMINEIYLRPSHEKSCFFPNFKDQNDAKENFKIKVDTVMNKLKNNDYDTRDDIYKMGDAMYFIPLEDIKKNLPPFLK